jgi:virginiamycin B lyase
MPRRSMVTSVSFLVFAAWLAGTGNLPAQTGSPALTGKVTAGQDALEGVLVSAKRSGSPITGDGGERQGRPLQLPGRKA